MLNTTCPCELLLALVCLAPKQSVLLCFRPSALTNHSRRSACESAEGRSAFSASVRLASVSRPRQRGSAQGRRPSGKIRKSICRSGAQGRREGVSASRAASCFQGHQILRTHELERAARARRGGTGVTLPVLTRLIPFNTRCLGYCKKKEPATAFRSMTM